MSWKQFVDDYLTFTKKERLAAICVLLIVACIYLLPKMFPKKIHKFLFNPTAVYSIPLKIKGW